MQKIKVARAKKRKCEGYTDLNVAKLLPLFDCFVTLIV